MTSVLLYTATPFQWIVISTSFLVKEHFLLELFKWENICNFVQIGAIVMFNNFYDAIFFFSLKKDRFLFVYAVN